MDAVIDQPDYINPNAYDVLLSDVTHDLLISDISERLGIAYLTAPTESEIAEHTAVQGILYGSNMRPMINLVVASKRHKQQRNIIFLVDTGSPHLYLCERALEALGFSENIPKTFDISFRGMSFEASMSPRFMPDGRDGHFRDINLIGSNFLTKAGATLHVNYADNELCIEFRH
jgi:hypothetical protein